MKLKKLRNLLESWWTKGMPRGLPYIVMETLCVIYEELRQDGKSSFFMEDVIPYLEKCGIVVIPPQGYSVNYTARLK